MIKKLYFILIALLLASTAKVNAQEDYRFDIGGGLGMTGYLGDANTSNLYQNPGFDAEILFRYIHNPRWAFKTNFFTGTLRGDSQQMTNVFPSNETYKFSTTFFELGEVAEFNFFNFGIGEYYRKLKRWSPYICAGLSATAWSVDKQVYAAFTLPFGAGVKFKLNRRLNLGIEFLMKKTFSDRLDGPLLDDPMGIESSFVKNTDWYSTLTISISYEFSKRCAECHYKN